jgi:hypothetical protein
VNDLFFPGAADKQRKKTDARAWETAASARGIFFLLPAYGGLPWLASGRVTSMWLTPGLGNLFRLFLPFGSKKRAFASPVWEVGKATASSVAPSERRRAQRRAGDPIQVLIATDLTGVQSIRGWVRDRSSTGLGLSCSQEVQPGTILYVRAAFVTDDLPWIAIAVKHCQLLTGRWILGCEFVEPPPKEMLLLFR